jgi:hypothetical protein
MKTHSETVTYWEVSDGHGTRRMNPPGEPDFAGRKETEAYARKVGFPEVIKQVVSLNEDGIADGEETFTKTTYRVKGVRKSKPTLPAHVRCLMCEQKADLQSGSAAYDWQWLHEFEHQGHCVEAWETDPASPGEVFGLRKSIRLGSISIRLPIEMPDPEPPNVVVDDSEDDD